MTMSTVVELKQPAFVWLDLVQPTREELLDVAQRFGLHATSVKDCLDPEHLPKFEPFEGHTFVIIRAYDQQADPASSTVQELTRKIAIFYGSTFLITIHRTEQPWLANLQAKYHNNGAARLPQAREGPQPQVLSHLLNSALDTYLRPMEAIEVRLDGFEERVFAGQDLVGREFASDLRSIHVLKRQVTLIKRLLWRMLDVVQRVTPSTGRGVPLFRDVQESVESYHFFADELLDDANTLLNVQLALASHRTGEVVRVLTVFSVFFLPLTFIVGIYGMNFDFMPELRQHWGYPAVMALMALVTLAIYLWFRHRGWLRR
ncbi:MAG: magnesium transporter CorA [Gemmatimonadales bacterium]|nr:magnesium transporter CorA [Gemmatimonadales bacterium]